MTELGEIAHRIEELRIDLLCKDGPCILTAQAEQFYLLAIGALESAQRFMKLAEYHARDAKKVAP